MKRLYYLLVILLGALYLNSCTEVRDKCDYSANSCDENFYCYAGWCSDLAPDGSQYFDVKLLDSSDTNKELTCEQANITKIAIQVYRDNVRLPKTEPQYENSKEVYGYQYELDCKDVITKAEPVKPELKETKYFYLGRFPDYIIPNAAKSPLQLNKDYIVRFVFMSNHTEVETREVEINADLGYKEENLEKVYVNVDVNPL